MREVEECAPCRAFCYPGWCMVASAQDFEFRIRPARQGVTSVATLAGGGCPGTNAEIASTKEPIHMDLVGRVTNILLRPTAEWPVIEPESISVRALYRGYIMPLAAIGPVAMLIGMSIIGVPIPSIGTVQVPFSTLLPQVMIGYGLGLGAVYVLALIIDALAPAFGGKRDRMQALKVAAYAATASWIGGVFHLVPALGILGLLAGGYTLYLFYLGLPVLMKSPSERSLAYAMTIMAAAVVLTAFVGILSAVFVEFPAPGGAPPEPMQPQ